MYPVNLAEKFYLLLLTANKFAIQLRDKVVVYSDFSLKWKLQNRSTSSPLHSYLPSPNIV